MNCMVGASPGGAGAAAFFRDAPSLPKLSPSPPNAIAQKRDMIVSMKKPGLFPSRASLREVTRGGEQEC